MKPAKIIILLTSLLLSAMPLVAQDHSEQITQLNQKGIAMLEASHFVEALEYLNQALNLAREDDNERLEIITTSNIGAVYGNMGDEARATSHFLECYSKAKELGLKREMFTFALNLVGCYSELGEVEEAKAFFREQTKLMKYSDRKDVAQYYLFYNQAMLARAQGDYATATYYNKQADNYALEHNMGLRYSMIQHMELGKNELAQDHHQESLKWLEQAKQETMQMGDSLNMALIYRNMNEVYTDLGDTINAQRCRAEAMLLEDKALDFKNMTIVRNKIFQQDMKHHERELTILENRNRQTIITSVIFGLLFLLALGFFITALYQNRKLRVAQKTLVRRYKEMELQGAEMTRLIQVNRHSPQPNASPEHATHQTEESSILLNPEQRAELLRKIDIAMRDKELLCNPNLGLTMLAERVESNTSYVSWVINYAYGKNLRSFINLFRIQEACRLLSDPQMYGKLTIRSIHEMVGFNSASSFNQAFKKEMGMTPSDFIKTIKDNS